MTRTFLFYFNPNDNVWQFQSFLMRHRICRLVRDTVSKKVLKSLLSVIATCVQTFDYEPVPVPCWFTDLPRALESPISALVFKNKKVNQVHHAVRHAVFV